MRKIIIYIVVFILASTFTSCAYLFNAIVLPRQFEKCEIIDTFLNQSVWSDEGCGGEITNLEKNAKADAYDRNQGSFVNRYEVNCTTWTIPK